MSVTNIILAGLAVVIVAVVVIISAQRRARWEHALRGIAQALKGRHTKGRMVGLAFIPGQVEAKINGRDVTIEQETYSKGSAGSSRENRRLLIKISTPQSRPEYLGPATRRGDVPEVIDYGRSNEQNGPLEIGGQRIEVAKLSKKLAKRLDADPSATDLLAQLFNAGGHITHGTVVLHGSPWDVDAANLEERVRVAAAVADLID